MSDIDLGAPPPAAPPTGSWRVRLARLAGSRAFQRWAARFPLTRRITRREGEAIFDLVAGFVHTQVVSALVDLDVLDALAAGPAPVDGLARRARVPPERMTVLLRAAAALGLVRLDIGTVALTVRGAAMASVPGLQEMIRHHAVLYRDLADPAAFLRGDTQPDLASFWPYVFGAGAAEDSRTAKRYSRLMAESQELVADDTLDIVSLRGVSRLMDVGGGTGVFLSRALDRYPALEGVLFDLPAVVSDAALPRAGGRGRVVAGSFRDDPLPAGADAISLVRVLYDHDDDTVAALLRKAYHALPAGGRLIVSEPMLGSREGDAYFALYTLAMGTGRTRAADEIAAHLRRAGFSTVETPAARRPFVTSVVTARRVD